MPTAQPSAYPSHATKRFSVIDSPLRPQATPTTEATSPCRLAQLLPCFEGMQRVSLKTESLGLTIESSGSFHLARVSPEQLRCQHAGLEIKYARGRWPKAQIQLQRAQQKLRASLQLSDADTTQCLTPQTQYDSSALLCARLLFQQPATPCSPSSQSTCSGLGAERIQSIIGEIIDVARIRALSQHAGLGRAQCLQAAGAPWAMPLTVAQQRHLLQQAQQQKTLLLLHHQQAGLQQTGCFQLKQHGEKNAQLCLQSEHHRIKLALATQNNAWLVLRQYRGKWVSAIEWLTAGKNTTLSLVNLTSASRVIALPWHQQQASFDCAASSDSLDIAPE